MDQNCNKKRLKTKTKVKNKQINKKNRNKLIIFEKELFLHGGPKLP